MAGFSSLRPQISEWIESPLRQDPGIGFPYLRIRASVGGLLNLYGELEVRARYATSPPVYFPACLKKLDVRPLPQVQGSRRYAPIESLGKPKECLSAPVLTICGTPNGNVQGFLLKGLLDPHDQQEGLARQPPQLEWSTLTRRFHLGVGGDQIGKGRACRNAVTHNVNRFPGCSS